MAPTLRSLEAKFGRKIVFIPHYEFDQLPNKKEAPTIAQIEYIQEKFIKYNENKNISGIINTVQI